MTSYTLPDLTGKNPNYLFVNIPFFIYDNNIKMTFENSPVFASELRMALTDGSGTLLLKDTHWRIEPDDIDQTAMGKAFLEDRDFKGVLLKSVTFISPALVGKQIAANVQQFYDTVPNRSFDDGTPLELTPALVKYLITRVADLGQQVSRVASPVTPIDRAPNLLKYDINAEFDENKVTEIVTVNTVGGGTVIRLKHGAFFADSLVIKRGGVALVAKTDYRPIMVSPLTKRTKSVGGIYQYIEIIKEIADDLEISYHAVGGEVQIDDVDALFEMQVSIKQFLDQQIFITPETVSLTPAFRAIDARQNKLETQMRNLLSGAPTYGDTTANVTITRPIRAIDAKFHWWNVATLFKVTGSSDIVTADQFKGRVFFPGSKVAMSFTVDVNLNQPRNPVSFHVSNLVFDPLYTLFESVTLDAPVYPMLRVVWNNVAQGLAGATLQIGLPLRDGSDLMVVEDLSTQESCWLLDKSGQQITGQPTVSPTEPKDTGFTLPDGASIWSNASASSKSAIHLPDYKKGYLVYMASDVDLASLATTGSTKGFFSNLRLPVYVPLDKVSALIVTVAGNDGSNPYDITIDLASIRGTSKKGRAVFVDVGNKKIAMVAELAQDTNGVYSVALNLDEAPSSTGQIIRYIRARA